ncbi:MAG: LPS export ABC transporter periplasmic protein LptC [Oligoflexales bacterium]|nr:LPS export ABC transporter periplasmic protein LptC [Oligoflexales bacterium]
MGRYLLMAAFCLSVLVGGLIYFTKSSLSLKENLEKAVVHGPKVRLSHFTIYKFYGGVLHAVLNSTKGEFRDPGILQLEGKVHGLREGSDRIEFNADELEANFRDSRLDQLLDGGTAETVELRRGVQVQNAAYRVTSELVHYRTREEMLSGPEPVSITAGQSQVQASGGFKYDIKSGDLSLFGKVYGVLYKEQRKN